MTTISSTSIAISVSTTDVQNAKHQCESAQAGSFDALFSMFSATQSSTASTSSSASSNASGQGNNSISGIFDVFLSENSADSTSSTDSIASLLSGSGGSTLSSDFSNTFGSSGPLVDWIKGITSALHLSSSQSQALQSIAVEHKDDAGTATSVTQQIAAELKSAGIG